MTEGEYKDIEFVDERNNISLIAEAVAVKFLYNRNLLKDIEVNSSGIFIRQIKTADDYQLLKIMEPYLGKFFERKLITPKEAGELRKIVEKGIDKRRSELKKDKATLERLEHTVDLLTSFFNNEISKEKSEIYEIIKEKGLGKYLVSKRIFNPKQIKARQNAELIFPMSQHAYERTKRVYSGSPYNPKIKLLALTDRHRLKEKIEDPFLFTSEEYREIANDVEDATINTLKKYFK